MSLLDAYDPDFVCMYSMYACTCSLQSSLLRSRWANTISLKLKSTLSVTFPCSLSCSDNHIRRHFDLLATLIREREGMS